MREYWFSLTTVFHLRFCPYTGEYRLFFAVIYIIIKLIPLTNLSKTVLFFVVSYSTMLLCAKKIIYFKYMYLKKFIKIVHKLRVLSLSFFMKRL